MLLKFGTTCRSRGEDLGTVWGACIEPREKLLLRLIVEQPQADPLVRSEIPFNRIDRGDSDQVVLHVSSDELNKMPRYEKEVAEAGRKGRRRRRGDEILQRVYHGGTRVWCRDGEAGALRGVIVDARSGDLEEIALEFGGTVTREIVVAAKDIEEFGEERVDVALERDQLSDYPSLRG